MAHVTSASTFGSAVASSPWPSSLLTSPRRAPIKDGRRVPRQTEIGSKTPFELPLKAAHLLTAHPIVSVVSTPSSEAS